MLNNTGQQELKRISVAEEVLGQACRTSERSLALRERLVSRLAPIMTSASSPIAIGVTDKDREYPPLFAELRDYLMSINNSLDIIDDAINRTEI